MGVDAMASAASAMFNYRDRHRLILTGLYIERVRDGVYRAASPVDCRVDVTGNPQEVLDAIKVAVVTERIER